MVQEMVFWQGEREAGKEEERMSIVRGMEHMARGQQGGVNGTS